MLLLFTSNKGVSQCELLNDIPLSQAKLLRTHQIGFATRSLKACWNRTTHRKPKVHRVKDSKSKAQIGLLIES